MPSPSLALLRFGLPAPRRLQLASLPFGFDIDRIGNGAYHSFDGIKAFSHQTRLDVPNCSDFIPALWSGEKFEKTIRGQIRK